MKNKIIYFVSAFTLLAAFALVGTVIYWNVYPYKAFSVTENPVPVVPPIVHAGEYVVMQFNYCRIPGTYHIKRLLVSEKISIDLPAFDRVITTKGCGYAEIPNLIPKVSNPGIYHLEYETTVQVNPLRVLTGKFQSQDFTLVQ